MPHRTCQRHGNENPCTCAMGNLYRFVEPVLLFLLKQKDNSQLLDHWDGDQMILFRLSR